MVVIKNYVELRWDIGKCTDPQVMSDFIELGSVTKAARLSATFIDTGVHYGFTVKIGCFINDNALQKAGTKIREVWCSIGNKTTWTLLDPVGKKNMSSMLYGSSWNSEKGIEVKSISFKFYITGPIDQYDHQRFDVLLPEQLWEAATGKKMTNVEFVVNGHTFHAHKFILASRSPVFKAILGADVTGSSTNRVIIGATDPVVFQQFLHFLYTGQLTRLVSEELSKLALKYQVDTLIQLCQNAAALEKTPTDVKDLFGYFDALGVPYKHSRLNKNGESCKSENVFTARRTTETFTSHLPELKHTPRNEWIVGERGLFRYKVDDNCFNIDFCHEQANKFGWEIYEVYFQSTCWYAADREPFISDKQQMIPMTTGKTQKVLQAFHLYANYTSTGKCSLGFTVHLVSSIKSFDHGLRDTRYAEELWSSAVNKEGTDIEFRVGDRIFSAHQALLVARCPALALLAPNDEGHSEPIPIDNVDDPSIFEDLLYFIYTGMTRHDDPSRLRRFLEAIALDLFPMETLAKLRRATTPPEIDEDVLSNALLSIFT